MATNYDKYLFSQRPCSVSDNIVYTSSDGYSIFAYDKYCQDIHPSSTDKKIDVIVSPENEPMADMWIIEVKDYRTITKRPNKNNAEGLMQTLERKFADSHARLISGGCYQPICNQYGITKNIHYCAHIEPPKKGAIDDNIYSLLISVILNLIEQPSRCQTPNHTPLEILKSSTINVCAQLPWHSTDTTGADE